MAVLSPSLVLNFRYGLTAAEFPERRASQGTSLTSLGFSTALASLSFDKGFSREADRQLLELYIPEVVMPKRGKRNRQEQAREHQRSFAALRRKHNAIESDINALEHHGLDRCPDKGLHGFKRYVGFGVLAYNLHKIGRRLLERRRAQGPERAFCA